MLPTIASECSEFLMESCGRPLVKNLPVAKAGFCKVKVRHQRLANEFVESFNSAFAASHSKLLQRAVIARGVKASIPPTSTSVEPFYIFPINGFRYMYNPVASTTDYNETYARLLGSVGAAASEILKDLLKYDYVFDNLVEGIDAGSEIIIYGIPHYFALRKSLVGDYDQFVYS